MSSTAQIPKWEIKADYIETCNCDYGCPCNFSGLPTYGFCRALVFYHIRSGSYGKVPLDGIDVIFAVSWPKAIHEGNGTAQVFVSKKATAEQGKAVVKIFYGRAKGDGWFALFANTYKYVLEAQFVDIVAKVDGKKSSFSVPGLIDVQIESFKNPITGEEQDTQIHLPKGFIWKVAYAAKSRAMRILTPSMNFDESGKNAFYSVVEHKGP